MCETLSVLRTGFTSRASVMTCAHYSLQIVRYGNITCAGAGMVCAITRGDLQQGRVMTLCQLQIAGVQRACSARLRSTLFLIMRHPLFSITVFAFVNNAGLPPYFVRSCQHTQPTMCNALPCGQSLHQLTQFVLPYLARCSFRQLLKNDFPGPLETCEPGTGMFYQFIFSRCGTISPVSYTHLTLPTIYSV